MGELVLSKLDKVYRSKRTSVHAVKSFDLTVKPGEIVALLGSSGCGKTSTLRMIAGFEEVTSGSISLDGRVIHTLSPSQRGVAMAFEAYSLYPPLTIGENIAFALKAARLPAAQQQILVKNIAEMLEIAGILNRYPSSVSGGQQQRASLGRALVRKASLYLLDEPMGQLEPQLRAVLRGRIKHFLRENNCTTILVTHDQTEANALADRIAVMEGGVLQQYATPAELKARPANLFTGAFIGEPPMNIFDAKITAAAREIRFDIEGGVSLAYPVSDFSPDVQRLIAGRREVALGIRPHAFHIGNGALRGKVISCQWLGDQTHVAVDIGGRTVVSVSHARVDKQPGNEIGLSALAADLHIFDAETGRAVAHGGSPA
ncbi:MAG: ABC transporter ATP-binding protein [Rhizobiales bacterium]|nr:ABC transporter ATP-binding protein [Hyphomicrobiales bacterium]